MKVLVAEDEPDIRRLLRLALEERSYTVVEAANGYEAVEAVRNGGIQLAVMDVMMPGLDGFNALRAIRETSRIPVVMLTARGEEMDKVLGLGLGADDYIVKPFSTAELLARVEAQFRRRNIYDRNPAEQPAVIEYKELRLDLQECGLYLNGQPISLHAKEYKLLECFMRNPNKIFTKKQLYDMVWNDPYYGDDNTVMVTLSRLRSKIERDPQQPDFIITIRGLGYKWNQRADSR